MSKKMAKNDFALAFNEVIEEKQLSKEIVVTAIESAMVSAYRRAVGASTAQHVEAKLDPDTGAVTVFAEKEVVEDSVIDERTEVLLDAARKIKEDVQAGDMLVVESTPKDFGRVAAQTARQVIQQRIREAERSNQMEYFQRQEGEIVSGLVQAMNAQGITIGLDMKAEGLMPNNQKIPGERLKLHDRVRAVVMEVKDGTRGPQIVLSRAHRNFLRRLMENEVPEIYHGIVEIRAISREPGARAKVAVSATQAGIDPVGACVGMKGVRIQAIVKELHDEKIDVIQWDADPVVYISKAISPARVSGVYLAEGDDARTATVVVGEDQLSLAIGRDGQNARLAAKLTGWRIDIKSVSEAAGDSLSKLKTDSELEAMLPAAVELIPQIEEIISKKAEGRAIMPEEYTLLGQFVDRVERRLVQAKEDAVREADEQVEAIKADIPSAAFEMPITESGIKEHIINILTEAGYETVGQVMFDLKANPNKILGLAGVGAKAIQNIEETVAAIKFPEPVVVEEVVVVAESAPVIDVPLVEKPTERKKEAKKVVEKEEEDEHAKDGVSLDDLFQMKPEMFQTATTEETDDKKKDKKGKKKSVALEFDEERGEVVSRKKHKRGDGDAGGEDW
jgi:N utilization substance protein A